MTTTIDPMDQVFFDAGNYNYEPDFVDILAEGNYEGVLQKLEFLEANERGQQMQATFQDKKTKGISKHRFYLSYSGEKKEIVEKIGHDFLYRLCEVTGNENIKMSMRTMQDLTNKPLLFAVRNTDRTGQKKDGSTYYYTQIKALAKTDEALPSVAPKANVPSFAPAAANDTQTGDDVPF